MLILRRTYRWRLRVVHVDYNHAAHLSLLRHQLQSSRLVKLMRPTSGLHGDIALGSVAQTSGHRSVCIHDHWGELLPAASLKYSGPGSPQCTNATATRQAQSWASWSPHVNWSHGQERFLANNMPRFISASISLRLLASIITLTLYPK